MGLEVEVPGLGLVVRMVDEDLEGRNKAFAIDGYGDPTDFDWLNIVYDTAGWSENAETLCTVLRSGLTQAWHTANCGGTLDDSRVRVEYYIGTHCLPPLVDVLIDVFFSPPKNFDNPFKHTRRGPERNFL